MKKEFKLLGFSAIFVSFFNFSICAMDYWNDGLAVSGGYMSGTTIKIPAEGSLSFQTPIDEQTLAKAQISFNSSSIDTAGTVTLTPFSNRILDLGIKNVLHYGRFLEYEGSQADYMCLGQVSFKNKDTANPLVFSVGYGMDFKKSSIKSNRSSDIKLNDLNHAAFLELTKRFRGNQQLIARLSSFDDNFFPVFFTPYYSLGYSIDVNQKMTLGASGALHYTDQATLNGAIEGFKGKLFMVYRW